MDNAVLRITNLLTSLLQTNCPVLSGNMKASMYITEATPTEITICISAPFYDIKEWKKSGSIIYTGAKNGFTDYASLVNAFGGFMKRNKSQHWANRCCFSAVNQIANEIGASVNNELEL